MASFTISNAPKNLTMLDFNSKINSLGAVAKQCRFMVRISPSNPNNLMAQLGYNLLFGELSYLCESTELPGRGSEIGETRYYGPPIQFPYNTKYSNEISMSFICRGDSFERQLFDDWVGVINPINNFNFNYPERYYCTVDVFQLSEAPASAIGATAPKATYMWSLQKAWPAQVNPQPVTWADNDVLRLSVSFIYQYWTRPGRDATPGGPPSGLAGLQP
jgi:hypothetical protein